MQKENIKMLCLQYSIMIRFAALVLVMFSMSHGIICSQDAPVTIERLNVMSRPIQDADPELFVATERLKIALGTSRNIQFRVFDSNKLPGVQSVTFDLESNHIYVSRALIDPHHKLYTLYVIVWALECTRHPQLVEGNHEEDRVRLQSAQTATIIGYFECCHCLSNYKNSALSNMSKKSFGASDFDDLISRAREDGVVCQAHRSWRKWLGLQSTTYSDYLNRSHY